MVDPTANEESLAGACTSVVLAEGHSLLGEQLLLHTKPEDSTYMWSHSSAGNEKVIVLTHIDLTEHACGVHSRFSY